MKTIQKFALVALCMTQLTSNITGNMIKDCCYIIPVIALDSLFNSTMQARTNTENSTNTLNKLHSIQVNSTAIFFSSLLLRKPIVNLIHKTFPPKQPTNIEKLEEVEWTQPLIVLNL